MSTRNEQRAVARYRDGRIQRGTTADFSPLRESFHLTDEAGTHLVKITDLKAVFFVRDFAGNPAYDEKKGFLARQNHGKKVLVEFVDGETLFGYTLNYSSRGLGFFMFPGDPGSNNEKIFVVHTAAQTVKLSPLTGAFPTTPQT